MDIKKRFFLRFSVRSLIWSRDTTSNSLVLLFRRLASIILYLSLDAEDRAQVDGKVEHVQKCEVLESVSFLPDLS